jgi:hypothetical protein
MMHALSLGNKFMKLAYETLEDEPCSSILGHFNVLELTEKLHINVRVWCKLCKLE